MDENNMQIAPSDDGSVATTMQETPSEPIPQAPADPAQPTDQQPVEPAAPTPLYELPDGRKVDGETVRNEYTNLLSDYTKKSQELARLNGNGQAPITTPPVTATPENPYADPNYVPQTYEEIIAVAEERALKAFEKREADRIAAQQAVENAVIEQITEVKKIDPSVDENALFLHANKYGFRDLRVAHANMKDMGALAKTVQQTTIRNVTKRNDPVSTAGNQAPTGASLNRSHFGSAVDYLRAVQGRGNQ